MFKIGDFSKLTFVSVRMLRHYDEAGLFKPKKVDDFTGYRYYSAAQISTLNLIVRLRDMGFNVADITLVLNEPSKQKQKAMLVQKRSDIEGEIIKNHAILKQLNSAIKNMDKEKEKMSYQVKIKSIPTYTVVSVRDIIPNYASEGILWERIGKTPAMRFVKENGVCFAIYHDTDYKEKDVDVEVAMEVRHAFETKADYTCRTTEAVKQMASILVPGDYINITPAFAYAGEWIEQNGYTVAGKHRQLTIKGPWNETDTANYLTEIQIPVTK